MRRNQLILFTLITVFISSISIENVFAWGQTGHRAVAQVAQNHLSKKAKKELEMILGDSSYLPMVATWMDDIKSDKKYSFMYSWHYINIDEGETFETIQRNPKGDIIKAIDDMTAILEDDSSSKRKKAMAIKVLTHLLGDLHQPFHIGHKSDLGGNKVKVTWFGEPSNIHRVWDSQMIDSKQLSYSEIALYVDHSTPQEVELLQSASTVDMMNESFVLATKYYNDIGDGKLGYRYMYDNYGTLERRIKEAGIRLAGILNKVLG